MSFKTGKRKKKTRVKNGASKKENWKQFVVVFLIFPSTFFFALCKKQKSRSCFFEQKIGFDLANPIFLFAGQEETGQTVPSSFLFLNLFKNKKFFFVFVPKFVCFKRDSDNFFLSRHVSFFFSRNSQMRFPHLQELPQRSNGKQPTPHLITFFSQSCLPSFKMRSIWSTSSLLFSARDVRGVRFFSSNFDSFLDSQKQKNGPEDESFQNLTQEIETKETERNLLDNFFDEGFFFLFPFSFPFSILLIICQMMIWIWGMVVILSTRLKTIYFFFKKNFFKAQ